MNEEEEKKKPENNYFTPKIKIDPLKLKNILKKDSKHGLTGSKNLGNTCYMNSTIACLSNTIDLTSYFLTNQYKEDLNKENKLGFGGELAEEWNKLLIKYWIENNKKVNPSDLKKKFSKKVKIFQNNDQQDSHEFMTFFLDYLHEDLNRIKKKPYIEIEEQKKDEKDFECSHRFWDMHIKRNDSIITDLFTGQYKSTIECPKCKWISITYDPFISLSLPIPDKKYAKKEIYNEKVFFFIPRFSFKNSFQISLFLNPGITFNNIILEFKNIKKFPFKNHDIYFMSVVEKNCINIHENEEIFGNDNDIYYFCSEKDDDKCNTIIPLYFKLNKLNSLSSYPRFLFLYNEMSFNDLEKKIFFFARQYIILPFFNDEENKNNNFENIFKKDNYDIEELIKIMENEYNKLINNENNKYEEFYNDFPYVLYLQKEEGDEKKKKNKTIEEEEKKIYLINYKNKNLTDKLSELSINKEENISQIINLCSLKKNNENNQIYKLYLQFNENSKFIKSGMSFNLGIKFEYHKEKKKLNNILSLNDCLEYFRTEEQLDKKNEWYCKHCKDLRLAKKKIELFYLPKILIICLKRFSTETTQNVGYIYKNNKKINFPIENLDMCSFLVGPFKDNSLYDLYAVSQHIGNYGGGHYTAACKNYDKWYLFNDDDVNEINDENEIQNNTAYILFYKKKENQ